MGNRYDKHKKAREKGNGREGSSHSNSAEKRDSNEIHGKREDFCAKEFNEKKMMTTILWHRQKVSKWNKTISRIAVKCNLNCVNCVCACMCVSVRIYIRVCFLCFLPHEWAEQPNTCEFPMANIDMLPCILYGLYCVCACVCMVGCIVYTIEYNIGRIVGSFRSVRVIKFALFRLFFVLLGDEVNRIGIEREEKERAKKIGIYHFTFSSSTQFHSVRFDSIWFDSIRFVLIFVWVENSALSVRRSFIMLNSLISNNSKFCDMCFINSIEECIVCECIPGQVAKTEPNEKDKWNRMCVDPRQIFPKTQHAIRCDC